MGGVVARVITRLNRAGPLRQLEALVPGLAELGWTGPVLAGVTEPHEPDGSDALRASGADVIRVPSLRRALDPTVDARALEQLLRHLRRVAPDVVHTHMGKAGALGRIAARMLRIPCVHTLHGHHFERSGARGHAARAAERGLGRMTAALVCLSDGQRADVLRHRIVPSDRARVIAPGVRLDAFPRVRRPVGGGDLFRIVWTGRFVHVKNPELMVDAVAALPPDVHLTMWGLGPLRGDVVEAVRARSLAHRVRLPGATTEIAAAVGAADVFALSSRSEGMAIAAIEAMLLGVPVVVPRVGGMPDLVRHEETGLLVAPGDPEALGQALLRLRDDPNLRETMARDAERDARARFDGARLAEQTAALYAEVLARNSPGTRRVVRRMKG